MLDSRDAHLHITAQFLGEITLFESKSKYGSRITVLETGGVSIGDRALKKAECDHSSGAVIFTIGPLEKWNCSSPTGIRLAVFARDEICQPERSRSGWSH